MSISNNSAYLLDCFEDKIRTGEWGLDERIPTERELMKHYRASRSSIRTALKNLERRSLIRAVQGSGRRVTGGLQPKRPTIGLLTRGGELAAGGAQNTRMLMQVDAAVHRMGGHLVTFSINYSDETVIGAGERPDIDFSMVDGAIVFARQYMIDDIARLAQQMPLVALTHDASEVQVPSFFIDFSVHAALAVQRLTAMGHRRILLTFDENPFHSRIGAEMRRGFATGFLMCGLEPPGSDLVHRCSLVEKSGVALYKRLRRSGSDITAIISYGDLVPVGMIKAAREHGEDLLARMALVCLTDGASEPLPDVTLAHFRCPLEKLAEEAVESLQAIIDGQTQKEHYHPYYGQLVEGDTFRPPPSP